MMMNYVNYFHRRFLFSLCGSFLLLALLGPVMAQAATYYVSLSGSDSNPGTVSQPFKTFAKAVKPLRPGDTLYIRGGVWTERIDLATPNISGAAGSYIKIAGYSGEKVTIRYADPVSPGYGPIRAWGNRGYLIFENLILDGTNNSPGTKWEIKYGNHHFILRNIEIKNFKTSGLFIQGNDIQVIGCSIHDNIGERWYGIYLSSGSNIMIQGNKIYRNSGGGLHVYPGPVSNLTIRGNAIYSNSTVSNTNFGGIILYGGSTSRITGTRIYNNLVYKNGSSTSGSASGIVVSNYVNGTKILNNTVYGNKKYGLLIGFNTTTTNTVVQNNISYGNTTGAYVNGGASTTYTNNITTDPGFVDASASNFSLRSSSPGVNRGVSLDSVPTDYKNTSRPRGTAYDIGGYESY